MVIMTHLLIPFGTTESPHSQWTDLKKKNTSNSTKGNSVSYNYLGLYRVEKISFENL